MAPIPIPIAVPVGPLRVGLDVDELAAAGIDRLLARARLVCDVLGSPDDDPDVVVFDPFLRGPRAAAPPCAGAALVALAARFDALAPPRAVRDVADGVLRLDVTATELADTLATLARRVGRSSRPRRATRDETPVDDGDQAPDGAQLSPREADVLAGICAGLSNEDIGARLFLGINTVKTYIRTAYRKIGVESRTQAVLWGLQHGYGDPLARPTATPPASG